MNDNLEHIARDLKNISLTLQERQALRQTLVAAIQLRHPTAGAWAFVARHAAACATLGIVAMAGTGLAAAHNSLPGDLLYPIRLAVNDRIAVAVAGDEDARLDQEIHQMERAITDEELVASHELAELVILEDQGSEHSDDEHEESEDDTDLEAELRDLQHLLDDEEAAVDLELSL